MLVSYTNTRAFKNEKETEKAESRKQKIRTFDKYLNIFEAIPTLILFQHVYI